MTILIEKVEVLMAIKRTYGELGDAAALVAAMAQREEPEPVGGISNTPPDEPEQPVVVERRDPNSSLN